MIASVRIRFYLNVRLDERFMRHTFETDIFDRQAVVEPLLFVTGPDRQDVVGYA